MQNNIRELFNLLQFLNPNEVDAEVMEREYAAIDENNVTKLHSLLRYVNLTIKSWVASKDVDILQGLCFAAHKG